MHLSITIHLCTEGRSTMYLKLLASALIVAGVYMSVTLPLTESTMSQISFLASSAGAIIWAFLVWASLQRAIVIGVSSLVVMILSALLLAHGNLLRAIMVYCAFAALVFAAALWYRSSPLFHHHRSREGWPE